MNSDMSGHETTRVQLNKIKISRNSRLDIKEEELDGLMQSIKQTGLLQPIGLIKRGSGFEIAFGNRRFLACSKLGWTSVPAIVREQRHDFDIDIQNLTENIQRRNLGLAEIGRYVSILREEGLSMKEAAVRLGVTPTYVHDCLKAYEQVPAQFRNDIEVRTGGRSKQAQTQPGKISMRQVNAIVSAQKSCRLSKADQLDLFKLCKANGTKFKPESVKDYVTNLKQGKNPFSSDVEATRVTVSFFVKNNEYDRLDKKYVQGGPFKSVSAVVRAIIRGQIRDTIQTVEKD